MYMYMPFAFYKKLICNKFVSYSKQKPTTFVR